MEDWEHITTAPDQTVGEMLRDMLEENGVISMIQPEDAISFLGVSAIPCRIMVPIEQAEAARELIAEFESVEPEWEDEALADEEAQEEEVLEDNNG